MPAEALSKIDVAAIRKADWLTIRYYAQPSESRPSQVEAWKRANKTERDPYAQDVCHFIPATVRLQGSYRADHTHAECVAVVYVYDSEHCHARSVLDQVRVGDFLTFQFYADARTSPALREAGFAGDQIDLAIVRNNKAAGFFTLATEINDRRWRMCRGITERQVEAIAAE